MSGVIAISGNIGSGKSTLAAGLARVLKCDPPVFEDDLHTTQDRSLQALRHWMDRGGVAGEFDLSGVVEELQRRRRQTPPETASPVSFSPGVAFSQPPIVLETQFGRCHPQLAPLIGLQCWIDVPREIALARKLAQWSHELQSPEVCLSISERLGWIEGFCQGYLTTIHELLDWQDQQLRPAADIVVDGTQPPQLIIQQLQRHLSL